MKDIKFIPIGGMDEKGKNLYILEIDKEIFILDSGMKNPSFQNFGVDLIIPNFDYLIEKKENIKGILISNGHPDNIGSISYLVRKIPEIEIFASKGTYAILENELRKMKVANYNMSVIDKPLEIGQVTIKPFRLGSHFPDSTGYALVKDNQQIIYAVNYQMHPNEPLELYATDFGKIESIANEAKTIALISEASGNRNDGFSTEGNSGVIEGFKKSFRENQRQKLLVGAFYSDIKSIQQMIEHTVTKGKKVVIYGRALNETLKYLNANGFINLPEKSLISFTKINHYDDYVIFACHSSYNLYRLLSNIVKKEDKFVELSKDMDVYISAWPIPGAETYYYKLIDDFYKFGIRAQYVESSKVKGATPFKEDVKYLVETFRPTNLIAIKGEYRDITALNEFAKELDIKEKNTTLIDNGEKLSIGKEKLSKIKGRIAIVDSIVDGFGIGDIGNSILNERIKMGDSGAIFIGIMINAYSKELISKPSTELVGLTENPEYIKLIDEKLTQVVEETLPSNKKDAKTFDIREAKQIIRKKITNLCRRKLEKEPAVVPVIIEVR